MMGKRITIVIDETIHKKLLKKQAEEIIRTSKQVSLSRVINRQLAPTLGVKL